MTPDPRIVDALVATVSQIGDRLVGERPRAGSASSTWLESFRSNMTGVVGLAGTRAGLLAAHAGRESVRRLSSRLTGAAAPTDEELRDTLCELANMIAGNLSMHAKGSLPPLASSLPSVIEGENFYLRFVGGIERVILPFTIGGDIDFLVELVLGEPA